MDVEHYEPNVTCPFCGEDTLPSHELEWADKELTITQHCPQCDKEWYEIWELKRIEE